MQEREVEERDRRQAREEASRRWADKRAFEEAQRRRRTDADRSGEGVRRLPVIRPSS
jgi:hypothetical protein